MTSLGILDLSAVIAQLHRAIAMVLPSIWFEGFPLTIIEDYASGTPVIPSRIGSLAELVEDGVTGLLADPHDPVSLADRFRWPIAHPREMGASAQRRYQAQFRGANHLAVLLGAYRVSTQAGDG